jgi:hypothetical protein
MAETLNRNPVQRASLESSLFNKGLSERSKQTDAFHASIWFGFLDKKVASVPLARAGSKRLFFSKKKTLEKKIYEIPAPGAFHYY